MCGRRDAQLRPAPPFRNDFPSSCDVSLGDSLQPLALLGSTTSAFSQGHSPLRAASGRQSSAAMVSGPGCICLIGLTPHRGTFCSELPRDWQSAGHIGASSPPIIFLLLSSFYQCYYLVNLLHPDLHLGVCRRTQPATELLRKLGRRRGWGDKNPHIL